MRYCYLICRGAYGEQAKGRDCHSNRVIEKITGSYDSPFKEV